MPNALFPIAQSSVKALPLPPMQHFVNRPGIDKRYIKQMAINFDAGNY